MRIFAVIFSIPELVMWVLAILIAANPQYIFETAHYYPLQPLKIKALESYKPKLDGATKFLTTRDIVKIPEGMTADSFLSTLSRNERAQVHIVITPDGKKTLHFTPPVTNQ